MSLNGWGARGLTAAIGAAVGIGGLLLTLNRMQDAGLSSASSQATEIRELMDFKARIDKNVEEWRGDQADFKRRLSSLEEEAKLGRRERAETFRWMERVSAKLNVDRPVIPQSKPGEGGLQAAQEP